MESREIIDRLVADFHATQLPTLTPREITLPALAGKVDSIVGMRRSGKTWFVFQQIEELKAQGTPPECLLYVNFEDERLLPMSAEELHLIPEAMYRRRPDLVGEQCWLFFDEIQNVPGWERFVRRQIDSSPMRIVVTGSSAKLLSRELATSLRGRSLATEVLPFSFREALAHRGVAVPKDMPPERRERSLLRHHLSEYLSIGGFPEVQLLDEETRLRVLQDYVDVVLFRDVVERHGVANVTALRYLVRRLLRSPAGRFSINRFYNDLKSQGLRVSKDSLHEYLSHLEDAFLVFLVPVHTDSERKRMVNPRKCYLVDHALAHAHSFAGPGDLGHRLENVVYLELRRRSYECAYLTTSSGRELDFVARKPGGVPRLVQVCADLSATPQTRERELQACVEASQELGVDEVTVVNLEEAESLDLDNTHIRVVPAWQWLIVRD
jgi:predicted AAA+ superfamily ATPase